MATTYQWSEERQCMVPISTHVINNTGENQMGTQAVETVSLSPDEQIAALKAQVAELKATKKRGKTAAFDPGPNAVTVSTRIDAAWLERICTAVGTSNKSHALFIAVENYVNGLK